MAEIYGSDAFSPREIAEKVETIGVAKARLPIASMAMLGVVAGAFIGLGALFFSIVLADATLGFAAQRIVGGVVFSLGLFLVVVAGAELFTGNNLLAMAWADGKISTGEVLRNWVVVCVANLVGAAGLAVLVHLSGHLVMNGGGVGAAVVKVAAAKAALAPGEAFVRGILCNVLVCLAVWMTLAGRSVTDKFFAVLLPIAAFIAAGFEHSIANMYFFPLAMLHQAAHPVAGLAPVTVEQMLVNLAIVIPGNIIGGSVLVALVYWVIYRRSTRGN